MAGCTVGYESVYYKTKESGPERSRGGRQLAVGWAKITRTSQSGAVIVRGAGCGAMHQLSARAARGRPRRLCVPAGLLGNDRAGLRRPEALVVSRVSASASVSIVVNAARAIDIYYVVRINCILYVRVTP
jgi:hypothetical protein